jgi:hypothetical protein
MSTVDTARLTPAAAKALVDALLRPSSYTFWSARPALDLHAVPEATARALLALLTGVTAEEWDGPETGTGYRTYRGTLPCGLALEVTTARDEVPNLLDTAPQADLDGPADEARAGELR